MTAENASPNEQIVFCTRANADLDIGERTRRNWIAIGILPRPDGHVRGRSFWRATTYRAALERVLRGDFAQRRRASVVGGTQEIRR